MSSNTPVNFFPRWRAKVILLRNTVRERPEVQLKAIAYWALNTRRRHWGHNRKWAGNYLLMQSENPNYRAFEASLTHLKRAYNFDKVLFSCNVMKVRVCMCVCMRVCLCVYVCV